MISPVLLVDRLRRIPARGPAITATLGVALAIAILLSAGPAGIGDEARRTLAITVLGLGLWGAFPRQAFWPSVLIIGLVLVSRTATEPSAIAGQVVGLYGSSGVWTPLTGFLLAYAVSVTGLGRRFAFGLVQRIGQRPSLVILAVGIASVIIAPLSPSTTAKAFLLVPICVGLVDARGARPGSWFGAAVLLMAAAANNIGASMFLTATIPNFISVRYLGAVGVDVSWLRWLLLAGPPNLLLLLSAWIILLVLGRRAAAAGQRDAAGEVGPVGPSLPAQPAAPIGRDEVITAIVLGVALFAWVTEPLTGLNGGLIGLAAVASLFLPPLHVMGVGRVRRAVPWSPVALFFAALLLGTALSATAAFDPVVRSAFDVIGIDRLPLVPAVAVVTLLALFGHLVFTSTTAYATVVVPIAISVAVAGGLPPAALALPVAITIGYAFILPMNTVPNLIMLDAGYFTARQMAGYGTILTLAAAFILVVVAVPYWQFLGAFSG